MVEELVGPAVVTDLRLGAPVVAHRPHQALVVRAIETASRPRRRMEVERVGDSDFGMHVP